jgi:hypothetical protein
MQSQSNDFSHFARQTLLSTKLHYLPNCVIQVNRTAYVVVFLLVSIIWLGFYSIRHKTRVGYRKATEKTSFKPIIHICDALVHVHVTASISSSNKNTG